MHIRQMPLWIAQTNCWIVSQSKEAAECIIIDAPPSPLEIIGALEANGLKAVAILATHGHIDHVGGVATLTRAHPGDSLPVYINQRDKHLLIDPIGTSGMLGQELIRAGIDVRPPEIIFDLDEGDVFRGSGVSFSTLATPGHTQGSICFLAEDLSSGDKVLFSGDHLFKGSIGRTDLPGGSYEMLIESMRSKILPLADQLPVLPGHGDATTIGTERATNPFLRQM